MPVAKWPKHICRKRFINLHSSLISHLLPNKLSSKLASPVTPPGPLGRSKPGSNSPDRRKQCCLQMDTVGVTDKHTQSVCKSQEKRRTCQSYTWRERRYMKANEENKVDGAVTASLEMGKCWSCDHVYAMWSPFSCWRDFTLMFSSRTFHVSHCISTQKNLFAHLFLTPWEKRRHFYFGSWQ